MTKPFLTIGMAVYEDFDGCYFTVQALKMYHDIQDCEILVVDNHPGGEVGKQIQGIPGIRYIPMPEQTGTAQPRNRVFDEAQGDYVLCMDSHVLLRRDAVANLKAYYKVHPDTKDLLSGPILWDDLVHGATHFDDFWRGEMWGIWGQAWECKCRNESFLAPRFQFAVLQHFTQQEPFCKFIQLKPGMPAAEACPRCGFPFPKDLVFSNHEQALAAMGHYKLGYEIDDLPFEIPANGLGLFSCKKSTWQEIGGFNRHFRGFGGEEMYIHEKVRRHGGKNLCLPFLAWGHRFARAGGVKFPLTRYQKVRNYVLGAQELGMSLEPIEDHFVKAGLMPQEQWDKLLADPTSETIHPEHSNMDSNGRPLPPSGVAFEPDAVAAWCTTIERDLEKHIPKLAELASQCQHVTEFSGRRESTVGLWAGVAKIGGALVSYNTEHDKLLDMIQAHYGTKCKLSHVDSDAVASIEETDLLFLDSSPHTYEKVMGELNKYAGQSRHYIVLHDTVSFGIGGEGGSRGLWDTIKDWTTQHPEWFIAYHTPDQYGLTVLSREPSDKPEQPIIPWPKDFGPGTELKNILHNLGINPSPSCDCRAKAREMDDLGVEGCRREFDRVVASIKEGMQRWGWAEHFGNFAKAGFKAMLSGVAFKVSWSDPIPDLVRMAIDEAEKKEQQNAQ